MADKIVYKELEANGAGFYSILGWLGVMVAAAMGSVYFMEHNGHWVTGMTNQIVWGIPHVFAVFLIVAASGALNIASISSVFGKKAYKPLARMSTILALALLAGGLMVLVLDLGRPDRLMVAVLQQNFKSIFAWNIYLYTGFFAIVLVYMWMMMERRMNRFSRIMGTFAFVWRLALTTGTGSIFGFLVARSSYDAAVFAPLFIALSFSFGLAIFILVLLFTYKATDRPLGDKTLFRLKNLLGVFIAAGLYFIVLQHLTNLYATEHHGFEDFILANGGIYTLLFWGGSIFFGGLFPLALLYHPLTGKNCASIMLACWLVVLGGLATMYVIIIGGQAYPMDLFPGMEVTSSFFDGQIHAYTPSLPEILLGLGGVAVTLLITVMGFKALPILPVSLSDAAVDPAHTK